uniref:Uncharacterized protein n=1 Tax=Rhizophora mucronata TaxID=61149 RepID=A0A2P2PYB8_RHIMU
MLFLPTKFVFILSFLLDILIPLLQLSRERRL